MTPRSNPDGARIDREPRDARARGSFGCCQRSERGGGGEDKLQPTLDNQPCKTQFTPQFLPSIGILGLAELFRRQVLSLAWKRSARQNPFQI